MELWDLYDENRKPLNRTKPRGSVLEPGEYHYVVHVCLFNPKGELLIQQRQPFKKGWPGLWDVSVGGSVLAGETSREAAMRETMEEIGLSIDLTSIRPHLTVNFDVGFDDFYILESDFEISSLTLQEEEVRAARWASLEEILMMIDEGDFIPYYSGLIHFLFENIKAYGAIRK